MGSILAAIIWLGVAIHLWNRSRQLRSDYYRRLFRIGIIVCTISPMIAAAGHGVIVLPMFLALPMLVLDHAGHFWRGGRLSFPSDMWIFAFFIFVVPVFLTGLIFSLLEWRRSRWNVRLAPWLFLFASLFVICYVNYMHRPLRAWIKSGGECGPAGGACLGRVAAERNTPEICMQDSFSQIQQCHLEYSLQKKDFTFCKDRIKGPLCAVRFAERFKDAAYCDGLTEVRSSQQCKAGAGYE